MQITSTRTALGMADFVLVKAAGTDVAVTRRGSGQPLLCLHAVGHGAGDFEGLASRLHGAEIELVALDWPGHGNSPADMTGWPVSAARNAEILLALVPQLFPDRRPVLLGNSIGGAAAVVAAARAPELFAGLVLCNPGGLAPVNALARRFCRTMAAFFRWGASGTAYFPALFGAWYRMVLPLAPMRRAGIVAAGPEMAGALAEAWAGFSQSDSDIRGLMPQIRLPVLFAWARDDRIVSWARSRAAIVASGAEVAMFAGGHSPFLEDPEAFATLLRSKVQKWRAPGA